MQTQQIPRFLAAALVPIAAAGLFLTRPGAALRAQSPAPAAPETVTYESGSAAWLSAPHTLQLSSGVQFGQDDAVLKTDAAVALLGKDQSLVSAKAQGPVHLYDAQDDLVGQHGSVDFTKHTATLRDNIILVVKPGKREADAPDTSPRRQFKDPATLTCQLMTYDYKFKVGRIPGPLTVTQTIQTQDDGLQTRTLTADAGLYDGRAQTIQLVGDIKGTYSDGSKIEGDTRQFGKPVLISIKDGAEGIFVPFPTHGAFAVKAQASSGKNDKASGAADDEPDLSLPVPPPHISTTATAPTASSKAPAAAPPMQTAPVQAPPAPIQAPAPPQAPASAPASAGAPAGSP